jgi:DNA-binding NarL/FixJ family response regulator
MDGTKRLFVESYSVYLPELSGDIHVGLSPQVNSDLERRAQREGVPLNQLLVQLARKLLPHLSSRVSAQTRAAKIRELYARGVALNAIAKELGVNRNTVRYHLRRMQLSR